MPAPTLDVVFGNRVSTRSSRWRRQSNSQWGRFETAVGAIIILTPTQCVMVRLSAYYAWNDPQSLQQALLAAAKQQVDLSEIQAWSEQEGELAKYETFLRRLGA